MKTLAQFFGVIMISLSLLSWFTNTQTPTKKEQIPEGKEAVYISDEELAVLETAKIIADEEFPPYKRSMAIQLQWEVSQESLVKIGRLLREEYGLDFDRLFITYFLPGMEYGKEECWAYTHFDPILRVKVNDWTKSKSVADWKPIQSSPSVLEE